jgi:heme/copper-type cytochrome/quinol oxidase subunit 3
MAATPASQLALPPPSLVDAPPPPTPRPRVVLLGAALASAASAMLVLSVLGLYLARRADTINSGKTWLPKGAVVPLAQPTMIMFTMILSAVTLLWAAYALRVDDRGNAYLALGLTLVLGFAAINQASFMISRSKLGVRTESGLFVLVLSALWVAWMLVAVAFLALMAFRALSGQFRRIPDGINAAATFWITGAVVWFILWIAVFITK